MQTTINKGLGKKVNEFQKNFIKQNTKTHFMNCKQFNSITLEEVLLSLGHLPTKQNEKEAWYLNPFANESQASFKLDKKLNLWYLFSEGIGGNNTDFMMKYHNSSVKEVLEWAAKQNFSSFQPQYSSLENPSKSYEILEIKNVQHPSLIQYLQARKLETQKSQLEEIHYKLNGRNYFGIGFKNDSGGYEIRNPHIKICLGKKDISTIKKESTSIRVFEGFTDYLSFRILEKPLEKSPSDYLILNSVSMIKRTVELLKTYPNIELFLDNDRTGDDATQLLQKEFPYAQDNRFLYQHCKDLNEFLTTSEIPEQRRRKIGR